MAKKKEVPRLSVEQANAINQVRKGADVYSYALAGTLREVESLQKKHKLAYITITKSMNAPEDGAKRQPYFGCIASKEGAARAKEVLQNGA